jgi:GABA permease
VTSNSLQQTLKQRHITMIALGGVIGAGLFVGSGSMIATAGPGAILSYVIGSFFVTLVMFMLGEMASRNPDSGSFSTFASKYLGEWAGYSVGWLYWGKSMVTITVEALLLGAIINDFFPDVSAFAGSVVMLIFVIVTNSYSVKMFGEAEYWLSFAKVATIILFILFGLSILFGFHARVPSPGFSNLTGNGGFLPNGFSPVIAGIMVVIFSFGGSEIAAIAAGESENPKKNVVLAVRSLIIRVMLFYICSITILVLCLPWTDKVALKSPYVSLFSMAGFTWAAVAMKIVLFVSFMSVMNSFLYSNSRMMYSLSQRGYAPKLFGKTNAKGTPVYAIALSFALCLTILITQTLSGGDGFMVLAKMSGAIIIVVWMFIVLAHWKMRKSEPNVDPDAFRVWAFPFANIVALLALGGVLVSRAFDPTSSAQFWLAVIALGVLIASYFVLSNRRGFGIRQGELS